MAEKRKLLAEIDKCFKKIDEGVEIFEETMAKMHEANSDNQREKFQDDLKKEIKKLQRLRDQIKGWQNSSDIKDKDKLSQYRKLIEQRMETFKDIERENKTKPHSKQGLSAEDKLDPKEKEKSDAIEWFNCQIRRIQDEIDRMESKLETFSTAEPTRGKRGKKEEPKKADKEKVEEIKRRLEKVKFHLTNLEVCMRLITNEKLDIKLAITKLKEPIELYVDALDPENDEDPETLDPDDIYEELDLSSYIPVLSGVAVGSVDEERSPDDDLGSLKSPSGSPPPSASKENEEGVMPKQRHQSGSEFKLTMPSKPLATTPLKLSNQLSGETPSLSSPPPATPPPPPGIPYNSVAAGKHHATSLRLSTTMPPTTSTPPQNGPTATTPVKVSTPATADITAPPYTFPTPSVSEVLSTTPAQEEESPIAKSVTSQQNSVFGSDAGSAVSTPTTVSAPMSALSTNGQLPPPPVPLPPIATPAPPPGLGEPETVTENSQNSTSTTSTLVGPNSFNNIDDLNRSTLQHLLMPQNSERSTQPQTATIPPWLGASPLGPVHIQGELDVQMTMVEAALPKLPVQMDSEKPRSYLPKMPCRTAPYYPQTPLSNADTLEYYLRLAPETLFFTFYYMEGSRAQLLAAKALKKLSWRFHTKYLMWFQRHEEPKQITDDYEQGTYVYFDFEKWAQRKKEQFTFEYRYLEDG